MRVFPHRKSLQPLSFYKGCACARKAGYGDLPLTLSHRAIIAIIAINATFFMAQKGGLIANQTETGQFAANLHFVNVPECG